MLPSLLMGLHADDWFLVRPQSLREVAATFAGDWNVGERGIGGFYRPMVRLSFFLERPLHGGSAWGYHLTNAVLFSALLALGWRLANRLLATPYAGLMLGVVILLSPLKTEALFWVSGRTDLLATLFATAALVLWIKWLDGGILRCGIGALAMLLLALLSKETALPVAVAMALAWLMLARDRTKIALGVIAPLALVAAFFLWRQLILGGLGGYRAPEPRTITGIFSSMLGGISALTFPWQCSSSTDAFSMVLGGVALAALAGWLWLKGFPRIECWLALTTALLLAPTVFAPPSPADGTRLLLLPALSAGLLIVSIFRGRLGRLVLLLAVISLQPWNFGAIREFVAARGPNAQLVDQAMSAVAKAGDGQLFIVPVPPRSEARRILDPGLALDQAIIARWLGLHPGAQLRNLASGIDPIPAVELRAPDGTSLRIASTLFPGAGAGAILRSRQPELLMVPFAPAPPDAPMNLDSHSAVAAELVGVAAQLPALGTLSAGGWSVTQPFFRLDDESARCWLDTLSAPSGLVGQPTVGSEPVGFQLRHSRLQRFDLSPAQRILP
ncbi:hypothetical protein GC173_17960 [bacterium]|nr:hypothetical protein [bacterium]